MFCLIERVIHMFGREIARWT